MRLLPLVFVLLFPAPVRADWAFVVEGKVRYVFPQEARSGCLVDKASWKWTHPDDRTECRQVKEKGK